ncbi:MAG: LamG domain-containing protein, partial [Planctomycetota bacterium]
MFRKSIFIISFVAALGMGLTTPAKAADPDLAAYWGFDEGSGTTAFDLSGNGNDGTFVGDPQWVVGMYGGALEFDGDDYINCGNGPSLQIQAEITMAFWFQVQAFQNTWEGFMAKGDNSYRASRGGGNGNATHMGASGTSVGGGNGWFNGTVIVTGGDWHHYAATYDGVEGKIYIDGVLDVTSPGTGQINISGYDLYIGENSQATGRFFHGLLDDVRIYSRALTEEEIQGVMAGGGASFPFAAGPGPEDGALVEATWATMTWRAGDSTVSHDVYLSDNFDDVNDGSEAAFQGSKPLTDEMQIVGFFGYPFPDGLVPGTTYYWRIDEVNDADPNSPWVGPVWSFTVPSKTAYNPAPADEANYAATDAQLSWTPGFGAMLHTVYFGDDFDTVSNATGGPLAGETTFNPGPLEKDKTYYWRVDEFEAPLTHKGDVWSFRTVPDIPITDPTLIGWWKFDEGAGTVAVDSSGHDNHGELRGDPQWTEGPDGGALDFDGGGDFVFTGKSASDLGIEGANAKSVTAWVFTRNFNNGGIFDLGARSNGQDFCLRTLGGVNNWRTQYWGGDDHDFTHPSQNEWVHFSLVYTGTQSTVYANGVSVSSEARNLSTSTANPFQIAAYGWQANFFDGVIDDVRLYNKGLTVEEITVIMRGDTTLAGNPSPRNSALVDVKSASPLTWDAGDNATQQDVYLATDRDALDQADATDTTGVYRSRQAGTSFAPPEGLPWGTGPYFWRVDQVNSDGTIGKGRIWSFTVADFLIVDDMESYTDDDAAGEAIWQHWIDGFDDNANGSQAGNLLPPYAEQTIVHGGGQSLPLFYTNTAGVTNSEAELAVSLGNWTDEGVGELSIW